MFSLLTRKLTWLLKVVAALGFAVGLATALGRLHERELIHKDVKPTNVLVISATVRSGPSAFGIALRLRREHQPPKEISEAALSETGGPAPEGPYNQPPNSPHDPLWSIDQIPKDQQESLQNERSFVEQLVLHT